MHDGYYDEASKFIDLSKINFDEVKNLSMLAKHYARGATFFDDLQYKENHTYETGFKAISDDNDKQNDQVLEFIIGKVNGHWKVVKVEKY